MNNRLYPRLAAQNMRKNRQFYLPYLLAIVGMAAGFYIIAALATDPQLLTAQNHRIAMNTLVGMMGFGLAVFALFVAIFAVYTNSFLMKRRRQELALYQVLGMEKRHIARILLWESLYTALIGIGGGLLGGIALHKLVELLLFRLVRAEVVFGIGVSLQGILFTVVFFCGLLLALLVLNLLQIRRVKPIELMRSAGAGEREPKVRWLLTALGIGALGGGYGLALASQNALDALNTYFWAVLLVVVGTYCLFTAVSIAALKLLKRRKGFYYRPNHFISVSGMLYRMKQNAVGMANVCILSTMVMVMLSGTIALYAGTEESINRLCPSDIAAHVYYDPSFGTPDFAPLAEDFWRTLSDHGLPVEAMHSGSVLRIGAGAVDGGFTLDISNAGISHPCQLQFLTAQDYGRLTETDPVELEADEALVYGDGLAASEDFTLFTQPDVNLPSITFRVAGHLPKSSYFTMSAVGTEGLVIVVRDQATLNRVYNLQAAIYEDNSSYIRWDCFIDLNADNDAILDFYRELYSLVDADDEGSFRGISLDARADFALSTYGLNGSFLFLGMFLSIVLIIASVLIIYYKQISEGYDDQPRFEIMQKVGLSRREARRTINHQILVVFFAPLAVAAMHILLDFRMLSQLLSLFNITNIRMELLCSLGTFGAFSLIYGVVYGLTARVYYRIVA